MRCGVMGGDSAILELLYAGIRIQVEIMAEWRNSWVIYFDRCKEIDLHQLMLSDDDSTGCLFALFCCLEI